MFGGDIASMSHGSAYCGVGAPKIAQARRWKSTDSFTNAQTRRFAFRCVRNKRPPRIAIETDKIDPCTPHFNVGGHPEKATLTKMGVYFARASTPPPAPSRNIDIWCARLHTCFAAKDMGVYFANTGLGFQGVMGTPCCIRRVKYARAQKHTQAHVLSKTRTHGLLFPSNIHQLSRPRGLGMGARLLVLKVKRRIE